MGEILKMKKRNLTSIEMSVLGLTWLRAPCTVYAVMKELSGSASSYHRSREGTAYSVAKRLVEAGFLRHEDEKLTVTPSGLNQLQQWIAPPTPMQDISHSADLIRLRFFFLGAVDAETRLAFIDAAETGLRDFLERCKDLIDENQVIGDWFGALATMSSVMETESRLRWLAMVRECALNDSGPPGSWREALLGLSEDFS